MRLKKIYVFVLKSYLGPLILTFFVALFILLLQFLWKWIDEFVGKGLEWHIIAELLFLASATFVPMALPLAILLASLMTFGNLGERYELVAMKAAGISLRKLMKPLIVLSIVISIGAFFFSNYILPITNLKFKSLLYDVRQQKLALNIREGLYYDGIEGYSIRVGEKDSDEKTIRDVMIYDHTNKMGNTNLTLADSGIMEITPDDRYLVLTLYSGQNYYEDLNRKNYNDRPFRHTIFKESTRNFDLSAFSMTRTNEDLFKRNYMMLNIKQLNVAKDSLSTQKERRINDFKKSFVGNYYYFRNKLDTIHENDTVISTDSISLMPDFLANFSQGEQRKIIENALNTARNTKTNIGYHDEYIKGREKLIKKHDMEWHRKFTLSFACIILFFIGAPLGAIIRKGGLGLPLVISVVLFVLYHIISTSGYKSAREGALTAFEGMWLASAVFLPIGIFLTYKATKDSSLMDTDAYKRILLRIKSIFKKNRIENT